LQEVAPGVAMDRAKHVRMGLEVTTPAGVFRNCIKVRETSEPNADDPSIKICAPGASASSSTTTLVSLLTARSDNRGPIRVDRIRSSLDTEPPRDHQLGRKVPR
jgi:hypothetical protein